MRVKTCSFSSDRKLARCEMQYSYRYDQLLKPRIKSKGLFMGDWMHQLIEAHYMKKGWEKKFKELKKKMWDPLFDEEKEMYAEKGFTLELAHDLMEHYVDHWSEDDKHWEIIEIEEYHKIPTPYGFPVVFKVDLLVREKKRIILVETKNKKVIPESDERILAPQVHSYCRLLKERGIKVDSILWNYIRTTPVPKPQIKKNGELSERKINTDQRMYERALKEAGIHPKTADEALGMKNKIDSLPQTLALERVVNVPNLAIGQLFIKTWVERHRRALEINNPLRTFEKSCTWMCDYYNLCMKDMRGEKGREALIKKDFIRIEDVR